MKSSQLIRARVEGFIRDYAAWNAKFRQSDFFAAMDWEAAKKDFDTAVALQHCVFGPDDHLDWSIGFPPQHSPESEFILEMHENPDTAVVETESRQGGSRFFEYTLQRFGTQWRIASIKTFFARGGERVTDVDFKVIAESLPKPKFAKELPAGLDRLFDGPARLQTRFGLVNTRIRSIGNIEAPSGFFTCDDPGQWKDGAAVFDLAIPPGKHEIELVIDDKLRVVGAARIVFAHHTKESVFAYATRRRAPHPRDFRDYETSYIVGVDSGMIGLADARAIIALRARERERLYDRMVDAITRKRASGAAFVRVTKSIKAVVINSGCGDGGYPVFWELTKSGNPISLVFDFMDLGQSIWKTVKVSFRLRRSIGTLKNETLRRHGIRLTFTSENGDRRFTISSKRSAKAKLYNTHNQLIFDTEGAGCNMCGNETTYYLDQCVVTSGYAEIQIYLGHRYEFAR
jgi:hypothetical protein